ncbi:hypothetical protein BYT27DRAFT_7097071 [Phlegmacium glaucopus]|nr:hypothetical protein BYT27DRAFT_7097071 [Phlegmacium glaucopus]
MDQRAHDSLYLVDGNIVLIAPCTTGQHTVFRVHQSILAKNSPVFETMLALPGAHANEMYDGVPLVQLPDGAEEVESLLRVLYHECALPFKRLDPNTPSSVKRVLTLANKYGMENLRDRIVMHVEADWPQSLWHREHLDDHLPEPASAIRLARECNIPNILPAAFYHLSRLSIYDNRCTSYIAQEVKTSEVSYEDLYHGNRTADWGILSSEDYMCLLRGKAKLALISDDLFDISQICDRQHTIDTCSLSRELTLLADIRNTCRRSSDILETLHCYLDQGGFGDQVCSWCNIYIRRELKRFRHTVWVQIPVYFGLT